MPGLGIAGIGPEARVVDQTVLDRVAVAMSQSAAEFLCIADGVFVKAALPDTFFALGLKAWTRDGCLRDGVGKPGLDTTPAFGIPNAAVRFGPYGVQMIRQHHHGVAGHRIFPHRLGIGKAQRVNVIDQRRGAPRLKAEGEEIGGAGAAKAAIFGHP